MRRRKAESVIVSGAERILYDLINLIEKAEGGMGQHAGDEIKAIRSSDVYTRARANFGLPPAGPHIDPDDE